MCQKLGKQYEKDAPGTDQSQAFFEQIFQLHMISGSVMVADDRRTADGVAEEDRQKDEVDIHDRAVRCDTVLSGKFHKLDIVQ